MILVNDTGQRRRLVGFLSKLDRAFFPPVTSHERQELRKARGEGKKIVVESKYHSI